MGKGMDMGTLDQHTYAHAHAHAQAHTHATHLGIHMRSPRQPAPCTLASLAARALGIGCEDLDELVEGYLAVAVGVRRGEHALECRGVVG